MVEISYLDRNQGKTSSMPVYVGPKEVEFFNSRKLAAQLTTALSSVENFRLLDPAAVTNQKDQPPFERRNVKVPLLYNYGDRIQRGVVGLDVSIVDGRSGQIVRSFPVQGSFSSHEAKSDLSLITPIVAEKRFAQSVLDQALRAALNNAVLKSWEVLQNRR